MKNPYKTIDVWQSGGSAWFTHAISETDFIENLQLKKRILPGKLVCIFLLLTSHLQISWAQCPAASSYATSTTVASCPSNGSMQFTNPADVSVSGGMGVSGAVYTITGGPAAGGYQTTGQSANRFDGLPAGTYSVTVAKPDCPDVVINNVIISSTYTPLSLTALVSQECANGQPGGTITASASGGRAPIQYAFVKAPNANIADNLLTYGPTSTTATGSFGLFQVRAKDGCGVFTTNSVDVEPTAQPANFYPNGIPKNCDQYSINGQLYSQATNTNATPSPTSVYKVELFDITSTDPCTIPSGASPFLTINASSQADLNFDLDKIHTKFLARTTSPCGDVDTRCYDLSSVSTPNIALQTAPSCQQINGGNGTDVSIAAYRISSPASITISSGATGTVLTTGSFSQGAYSLSAVAYDSGGYVVQVQDACGQVYSYTLAAPPGAGDAINANVSTDVYCADQPGAKRTVVNLSGGVTGLYEDGSTVQIIGGPSGLISPAIQADKYSPFTYAVNNLAPGVYTAQISTTTSGCGPTSFTFAVPENSPSSPGLSYNLTGSVQAFCGGSGNLTTSFNYNGYGTVSYTLTNSANQVIATNTNGVFTNLPADTYSVKASVDNGCGHTYTQTQSFVIPGSNSVPVIEKKVGIICENGNTATATGQAIFRFSGFAPYLLEISPTGTGSWSTVSDNVTAADYAVSNLTANATYDFRLTDNCGKSTVTTVSIKPLDAQTVENDLQPCNNQDYVLSAPDFPGATYSWSKDGSVIASSRQLTFTPYQSVDNGRYVVTITLPQGCVVRTATANLNSGDCGQPLPVSLVSFNAKVLAGQTVQLDWVTASEQNNAYFQLERSKDLVSVEALGRVAAAEGKALSGHSYRYVDTQPYSGTSYYRLRQVDRNGAEVTYPWEAVVMRNEAYGVMPNPVLEQRFSVSLDEPQTAKVQLFSTDGHEVSLERKALSSSRLEVRASSALSTGVYVLVVEERGQVRQYRLVMQK